MLAAFVIFFVISYIVYYYVVNRQFREHLSRIPCEPGLPLLGHALQLGRSHEAIIPILERMWNNLGRDKFRIQIGPTHHVIITKTEDVEIILSSSTLLEKNMLYKVLHRFLGDGLLTGHGDRWRSHRKILTSAFHFNILESYLPVMLKETDILFKELTSKMNVDVDVFSIFYYRSLITLCKLGLGTSEKMNINFEEHCEHLLDISALATKRIFSVWKLMDFLYYLSPDGIKSKRCIDAVYDENRRIMEARREELKDVLDKIRLGQMTMESIVNDNTTVKNLSFIELLLLGRKANGEPLSDKAVLEEVNTFTLAGHETLTTSSSFTLYALANNPEIQKRVFEEQKEITGGDLDRPVTNKELVKMKYLERVIKESLRLYSPVVLMGRKVTETITLKDGVVLPIGCEVLMMPYLSHRNPAVFPDPEKFDPDRFLNQMPNPYTYYPFSAGSRNCIGQKLAMMQLKVWLATIVRALELIPAVGPKPVHVVEITLKSITGVKIQVRRRSNNN